MRLRNLLRRVVRDERGAAVIETAFALPILILLLWMIVQLGLVFRAMSGIQHALGQGARSATLYPTPSDSSIEATINAAVYGIGPGTFTVATPVHDAANEKMTLEVTYTQDTDLLLIPGPTISVSRSKVVWLA